MKKTENDPRDLCPFLLRTSLDEVPSWSPPPPLTGREGRVGRVDAVASGNPPASRAPWRVLSARSPAPRPRRSRAPLTWRSRPTASVGVLRSPRTSGLCSLQRLEDLGPVLQLRLEDLGPVLLLRLEDLEPLVCAPTTPRRPRTSGLCSYYA